MNIEFELKIIVDHHEVVERLQSLGALRVQLETLMRRYVFEVSRDSSGFCKTLRVRDEGHGNVTLSLKSFNGLQSIDSVREVELKVSDFDTAVDFVQNLGYLQNQYVENYRQTWKFNDCCIMLDRWPWIEPFIEIEGGDEQSVRQVVALLGLQNRVCHYGPTARLYLEKYGITIQEFNHNKLLTFQKKPDWRTL
ncbi:CYTH domain-containing protein [Candidatus Babeliales bacterium]|nr:CYTH domain-containing protein [Candidatus Babeliales bacterium]